jgi:hypothetical protein
VTSLPVSIGPNQSIKILNADGSISSLASIGAHLGTAFTIPSDAVDWHRFYSDPKPDPNRTCHFDADPSPDLNLTPSCFILENLFLLTYIHSSASLHCFIFLVSIIGVINLNILGKILEFLVKYNLALHLVEMDTDQDRK